MKSPIVLVNHGKHYYFKPTSNPLSLNFSDYQSIQNSKFWSNYFKKFPKNVIVISYDFGLCYLLNKNLYPNSALWIQPVERIHASNSLLLPTNLIKQASLKIKKDVQNKIWYYFKNGYFYLINFTHIQNYSVENFNYQKKAFLGSQGAYIPLKDNLLISYSPELFLQIKNSSILTSPIKGTSLVSTSKKKLIHNFKEHTEQVMIVDLLRNDLGSICERDSIQVKKFKKLKKQDGLYQMYSTIKGKVHLNYENFIPQLLNICPAGSVTGVPKIEVCKFLDNMETQNRSFYTGIAGFYDFDSKKGFFNLLIRMLEISNKKKVSIGLGAGITIDSMWKKELRELILKKQSILQRF